MRKVQTWSPRAGFGAIRARAAFYAAVRRFFFDRDVLEVDTPILSSAATVDPNIDSFAKQADRWLQTSPEFAMKRLLAAGSGAIYQIAHVFRREECGRLHNPEFSLLEWYRPGWNYRDLMHEVKSLLHASGMAPAMFETSTYRQAFITHVNVDPFTASLEELGEALRLYLPEIPPIPEPEAAAQRDFHLDLLMSLAVAPRLGNSAPLFIYDFPASQAALARVRPEQPPVAERFELFWKGVELANGFGELTDADEQRRRFKQDQTRRGIRGQEIPPYDRQLIAALDAGFPVCSGVALGLDRVLMLHLGLEHLGDTLAFDFERA